MTRAEQTERGRSERSSFWEKSAMLSRVGGDERTGGGSVGYACHMNDNNGRGRQRWRGRGRAGAAGKTNKMGNISEHGERDLWPLSSQGSQWTSEGQGALQEKLLTVTLVTVTQYRASWLQ